MRREERLECNGLVSAHYNLCLPGLKLEELRDGDPALDRRASEESTSQLAPACGGLHRVSVLCQFQGFAAET
ncbi:hypothetical protein AAY473_015532 [Plecturocebus cupreus]